MPDDQISQRPTAAIQDVARLDTSATVVQRRRDRRPVMLRHGWVRAAAALTPPTDASRQRPDQASAIDARRAA